MTPCESWPARFAAMQWRATVAASSRLTPGSAKGPERLRLELLRRDPGHRQSSACTFASGVAKRSSRSQGR